MNRRALNEARLWLIAIPVLLWTLIPIYHIFLFSISTKDSAFSGALWPKEPTLRNFGTVFRQEHFYLHHFWNQIWNSLWIAVATGLITLLVATCAAFSISRSWTSASAGQTSSASGWVRAKRFSIWPYQKPTGGIRSSICCTRRCSTWRRAEHRRSFLGSIGRATSTCRFRISTCACSRACRRLS